jgi:predicted secreted protein
VLLAGTVLLKYSSFTHGTATDISITNSPNNQVPPASNKYLVTAVVEDFNKESSITKRVEVKTVDVFIVALDSNATTGFSWTKQSKIADGKLLTQTGHQCIPPRAIDEKPVTGMAGIEE